MTFGEKLKQARKNKGLSQAELARRVGISRAAISRYESGERTQISAPILISMAKYLGVNPLYLDGIEDDPAEKPLEETLTYQYLLENSDAVRLTTLLGAFLALNNAGRSEAVKVLTHLTYVPEYTGGDLPADCFNDKEMIELIDTVQRIGGQKYVPA